MVEYIEFSQIGITFGVLAVAAAFIVLVRQAVVAMKEWIASLRRPNEEKIDEVKNEVADVKEQVQDHENRIVSLENCCAEVHGKLDRDWQWQQDAAEMNRLILKSIKQLMKHERNGNDIDGLQKMENAIDDYLIENQK